MPVQGTDTWLLLYMVHSAVAQPMEAYIIYDIDFIPKAKGDELGIKPAYPLWLDVRPSGYPVFNTQRSFGGTDGRCTWPKEQCAAFNSWGEKEVGQGEPGNGKGEDWEFPAKGEPFGRAGPFTGGTILGMGGHMHPGGIQNEIDLVRGKKKSRIYTGKAVYWKNKKKGGGPKDSWDFSMPVVGNPFWGVRVKPGDKLRSNVTYDTKLQSTYENMGIAVSLLVPDDENGKPQAPGVNPFKVKHDRSKNCYRKGGLKKAGIQAKRPVLCEQGLVTHGQLVENTNRGHADGKWEATSSGDGQRGRDRRLPVRAGRPVDAHVDGHPHGQARRDAPLHELRGRRDLAHDHLVQVPVPRPDGRGVPARGRRARARSASSTSTPRRSDSARRRSGRRRNKLNWSLDVTKEEGYKPGEVVTYFCRIHPFMRGAFEVGE